MTNKIDIRQLRTNKRKRSARTERGRPVILACDTSTTVGSVALVEGGIVTAETVVKSTISHSLRILKDIQAMLKERELNLSEVDALVTAGGPGSFTGVRIAMSTMKGLAWSAGKPLIVVGSLKALAYPLLHRQMPVLVTFDARRREVYGALFSQDGSVLVEQAAVAPAELAARCLAAVGVDTGIICAGEGFTEYQEIFAEVLGRDKMIRAAAYEDFVKASVLGIIGTDRFKDQDFSNIATVEPVYLRRSEAEINLEKALKQSN